MEQEVWDEEILQPHYPFTGSSFLHPHLSCNSTLHKQEQKHFLAQHRPSNVKHQSWLLVYGFRLPLPRGLDRSVLFCACRFYCCGSSFKAKLEEGKLIHPVGRALVVRYAGE